jgi:hypothetical protein
MDSLWDMCEFVERCVDRVEGVSLAQSQFQFVHQAL